MTSLHSSPDQRAQLLAFISSRLEAFISGSKSKKVSARWDAPLIRDYARKLDLASGHHPEEVLDFIVEGLSEFAVHTPHPSYFGLFNPRSSYLSSLADYIVAVFNPQMAAWSHAPFANEIENYLVHEFGMKFGYPEENIDGTLSSGGAESNLTAVICALNDRVPDFKAKGLIGIEKQPVLYVSAESHHSVVKAASITGLGMDAVRSIAVGANQQIDIKALNEQIEKDKEAGFWPFLIVGTAGTTGSGAIDDLGSLSAIAKKEQMWFHVDAAYGGAITISEDHRKVLAGIELSDSITLDLHKWFSVPMGGSIFLTQHPSILVKSFRIKTQYMPTDGEGYRAVDPYESSIQWSRRFMGLKFFLPLAVIGWQGYEETINGQVAVGELLREKLLNHGWQISNSSSLPIICFTHPSLIEQPNLVSRVIDKITDSGEAWISMYPVNGLPTIRACITNYATTDQELEELIDSLEKARNWVLNN